MAVTVSEGYTKTHLRIEKQVNQTCQVSGDSELMFTEM